MLHLLYRQRRRILTCALTAAAGIFVLVANTLPVGFAAAVGVPIWAILIAGLAVGALGGALFAVLIVLVFPSQRVVAEFSGIVFFLAALAITQLPPDLLDGIYGGFAIIFVALAINGVIYGTWLDRFRLKLDIGGIRRFRTPLPPEDAWASLVPDPDHLDDHWDPLLSKLERHPEDDASFDARYHHGQSIYQHQTMTFLEREAPRRARYHHTGEVSGPNQPLAEGVYGVEIEPDGNGSLVTITSHHAALLPRVALLMWFDDALGDQTDYIRARHEGRRDWSVTGRYRREAAALS